MKHFVLMLGFLVAGCATRDPSIPRRPVDIARVQTAETPFRSVTLQAELQFSIPINSPIYKHIDVRLPSGLYELCCYDEEGYYFLAKDGRLRITGNGNSQRGGIFVPKNSTATWRIWIVPNYGAAMAIFGAGGATFGTGRGEAIRGDLIPSELSQKLDASFRAAIEPNQPPEPTRSARGSSQTLGFR